MRVSKFLFFILCTSGQVLTAGSIARDPFDEATRDIEEQRLQQLQTVRQRSEIKPFSTDGCSGFQSQNWAALAELLPAFEKHFGDSPPWENCCFTHDEVYWRGEVIDGYIKRKEADQALRQCIIDTGAELAPRLSLQYRISEENIHQAFSITAEAMYKAVRLGGLPCSLLPWRWGYGWDNCAFASIGRTGSHDDR